MSDAGSRSALVRRIDVRGLARVEGAGSLRVRIGPDGTIEIVEFAIFEPPRFFERLLVGRDVREVPDIVARICGICPVAYQLAACGALEAALGIRITPELRLLRRLLLAAEWIQSHAVHVFLLHAADYLGLDSGFEIPARLPGFVENGLRMKEIGCRLLEVLGGRAVHPVNVAVGGFHRAPDPAAIRGLVPDLEWGRDAALAAEQSLRGPMLAVVWDGAGLGDDNTVWGGEFLVRDGCEAPWRRYAHLPGFALLGGDAAARDPRRCAFALLWSILGEDAANAWAARSESEVSKSEREAWGRLLASGIACPWATSAGRWFDAVAGLLGISTVNGWEGEAAARLETAAAQAESAVELPRFGVERTDGGATIDGNALLGGLLDGLCRGIAPGMLARGFHQALARLIVDMARVSGMPDIGLTGGCFVNKLLVETTAERLRGDGFRVWTHQQVPPGDGNLAFGQLAWLSEHGEPATWLAGGHRDHSGHSPFG